MQRTLILAFLLLAVALPLVAQEQSQTIAVVSGVVSSVDAANHTLTLISGLVPIDASSASIVDAIGDPADFSSVKVGALVEATVLPRAGNSPMLARALRVQQPPNGMLSGIIQAIDLPNGTLTIAGLTVHVTNTTIFEGTIAAINPKTLAELKTGQQVTVTLNADATGLVATRIRVGAPTPDMVILFTATLRGIGGDVWMVTGGPYSSFHVTSSTTITGAPRIGDLIRVVARIDAGVLTAISVEGNVIRIQPPIIPPSVSSVIGVLLEQTDKQIVVDTSVTRQTIFLSSTTQFVGGPHVGDLVRVDYSSVDGQPVARTVTKVDQPIFTAFVGVVTTISGSDWTIGSWHVIVNAQTMISGDPRVGDRVQVVGKREQNGTITAISINKV